MDIKGNKVSFTPDEAHWAQNASARFGAMPDVAQRILDARTEYARPWFDSSEMPLISTAMRDIMSRVALNDSLANLHEATKRHITAIISALEANLDKPQN